MPSRSASSLSCGKRPRSIEKIDTNVAATTATSTARTRRVQRLVDESHPREAARKARTRLGGGRLHHRLGNRIGRRGIGGRGIRNLVGH